MRDRPAPVLAAGRRYRDNGRFSIGKPPFPFLRESTRETVAFSPFPVILLPP